ncbi:tripartite tricarboxylate transporter substrate binding protein [Rhodoplanes sp. TEM]|uniref:Tripartite tricarboxylate transporter substrate binding protein n=2 Tax=Hyphomicrobiales TaxID=356 RepID=A0ABT5JB81_RHOTP|nr:MULTISPECIES: tripartite tricarboxylate transporter substrate binding protein [Rhodoplanes]MDC7786866.1 tripartite tricarboxylate transporter substrate binding protein [Rhodoplanes tepidamans]MDC7984205.1 tripartite tricarboxylate transporter substrate binding protein [Rhodoplanes sp. TEM]MDQ0355994.1 tripartite-type tricarboxylate transporter receptor subunit TctC [Rhodoplanes tepidamans]
MQRTVLALMSAACVAVAGVAATSSVVAQEKYPSRTVKIIVPYAPGGATDIVARLIGEHMRQDLGQSFVVENKPGAFGIIAIEEMARAKPDGYTLMIGNVSTNAITPVLFPKKFKIDYVKDVVPVTRLVDIPEFMVATTKDFPPKNVKDVVDYAKKNPGKVRYGSVGVGSYPHYDAALFAKRAGDLDMVAIHNKAGASGVINDLVSGDAQFAFLNVASTAPMIKAGNLRPFALVNHARLPDYPDVPTMDELGYKGVGTIAWQGLFAPAGTPPEVLETLFKASVKAMQAPAVQEAFKKQNFNVVPSKSTAEAKTWLAAEMDAWKKIAAEVKIELAE